MRTIKKIVIVVLLISFASSCKKNETIDKYENGQVKLECEFIKGKRNGKCTGYYPNGDIEYISFYENDTLSGVSKFFHKNGQLHWVVKFEKGLKNGEVKYRDSLGRIYQISTFKNNRLNEKSFSLYPNGSVKEEVNFLNGRLDGTYIEYFEDGNVKTKAQYGKDTLLDFVKYDSLGNLIDHDIKYELEDYSKDSLLELNITVSNKEFDVVGLELSTRSKSDTLKPLETVYSKSNKLSIKKRIDRNFQDTVYLKIIEIENIEGREKGVIRSVKRFKYVSKDARS
jgi:antitoxin component YwqK of YwqJK toxin-antitoxin module